MKKCICLLLSINLILTAKIFAGEIETEIAKGSIRVYAEAQAKERLKNYLNLNPRIFNSTNPRLGDNIFKTINQVLSIKEFIEADTDGGKFWASIQYVASSNPIAAVIVMILRLANSFMDAKHQLVLAKMQEEMSKLVEDLNYKRNKVYQPIYEQYKKFMEDFFKLNTEVVGVLSQISQSKVASYINDANAEIQFSLEDLDMLMGDLSLLYELLLKSNSAYVSIVTNIDFKEFEFTGQDVEKIHRVHKTHLELEQSFLSLKKGLVVVLGDLSPELVVASIEENSQKYEEELNNKIECLNHQSSKIFQKIKIKQSNNDSTITHDSNIFTNNCEEII